MTPEPSPLPRKPFDRVVFVFLFLLGLWALFAPSFLGWGFIETRHLEGVVLRVLVAFLFLFLASGILERGRLHRRMDEVYELVNMLLYGKNYRADREAIRILLGSLDSQDEKIRTEAWEHLKRLTGQKFALDAHIWRSWWNVNEKRFSRRDRRPEE